MSWFAGCYHYQSIAAGINLTVPFKYDNYYRTKRLHVLSDKTNTYIDQSEEQYRILCGNVLEKTSGLFKLVEEAWIPESERERVSGHFIGMKYSVQGLEFYNDQFGFRELYYYQDNDGILYFSTRMDILLYWKKENKIDWEEFGSYWLNSDPLGQGYFIKEIGRLNQSGTLRFRNNQIEKGNKEWTAESAGGNNKKQIDEAVYEIYNIMQAPQNSGYKTILALSGGADSRALLAIMMHSGNNYEAITWGREDHPDVQIAKRICVENGIPHQEIYTDLLEDKNSWRYFAEYCGRCQLVLAGTGIFELHHYNEVDKESVFFDGGGGGIVRRRLNVSLEYQGKQAIRKKDVDRLLSISHVVKADIFTENKLVLMSAGLKERASLALANMPEVDEIGYGNWLDTWNIRNRAGNVISRSQQVMDDIFRNYMPYIQKKVVDSVMRIPAEIRSRNGIQERMIMLYAPQLIKIPRISYGIAMPYKTGNIEAKIRGVLGRKWSYKPNISRRFLQLHKERIKDIANDCQHHQREIYDARKIEILVKDYYMKSEREQEMIWWLSFEAFRQQFNLNE
jgi:asparagine synthetase B (glutamine-hydrolysing)